MAYVKLTRMVEKKAKWSDRSDLHAGVWSVSEPIWVNSALVAAVGTIRGPIEPPPAPPGPIDHEDAADIVAFPEVEHDAPIGLVTQIWLSGTAEPLQVAESADDVVKLLKRR